MRYRTAVLAGLTALGLLASACSGSSQPPPTPQTQQTQPVSSGTGVRPSGQTQQTEPEQPDAFGTAFSVQAALAEIPVAAVAERTFVQTADLRAATELAGLEYPATGTREDVMPWLFPLTNGADRGSPQPPVFVPIADSFNVQAASPEEYAQVLGWSVTDVDSFVEQAIPPGRFAVVTGDFDDDTLNDGLIAVEDGIVTDIDGEDFAVDIQKINAVSRIGVPTRLAQNDNRIALGTSTPVVRAWLDGGPTLADDESLSAVARALDDRDVVSAVLMDVQGGVDPAQRILGDRATPELIAQFGEEIDALIPADPYDVAGLGWSVVDGEPLIHAVYHFGSGEAATAGAQVLEAAYRTGISFRTRAPYSERMTVQEVSVDGSVVVVSVTPTDEGRAIDLYQAIQMSEPLFVSR